MWLVVGRPGAGSGESWVTCEAGRDGQQCLGYSVTRVREEEFCVVETLTDSIAIITIIFSLVKDGAGQGSFFAQISTYILRLVWLLILPHSVEG